MERKVLVVVICALVGVLGLSSAILSFVAEATRIKSSQVQVTAIAGTPFFDCVYPQSPAMALGSASAFSLLIAQIIINVSAWCIYCKRKPLPSNSNFTVAWICYVVSGITFIIAFFLLFNVDETVHPNDLCIVVTKHAGVFAGSAMLSLVSVALGIYYLTFILAKNGDSPNQGGIAMEQPQIPPGLQQRQSSTKDPVFVHEDTYIRRQFT